MKIRDFGVEIWMNTYENNCSYNLAETCVHSLSVEELLDLVMDEKLPNDRAILLDYTKEKLL